MANNAKMVDTGLIIQAGIDPKSGLPIKFGGTDPFLLKTNVKRTLRILDEQNAVNRYIWYNLPCNISSQELERMLYYKGQLCFFYCKPLEMWFFMPYALDGTIDFYGRYNRIHPVPFAGGVSDAEKAQSKTQADYLSTLKLNVMYDVPMDELDIEEALDCTVLLHDYSKQLSQSIIPRVELQETIIDIESELIPMMRTALRNSTGALGMRVGSKDEESNVRAANESIDKAVLNGQRYIPITGQLEFQELDGGDVAKAEEYMMAMQSIDNYRKSLYGLDDGGVFDKNQYVNRLDSQMNMGNASSPLNDGLLIRQRFCDVVNGLWGLGISCEIAECAAGVDTDMDGMAVQEQGQEGAPGSQVDEEAQV